VVESSALLKRRSSKGYRGFESLPHRLTMKLAGWLSKLKVFVTRLGRMRTMFLIIVVLCIGPAAWLLGGPQMSDR
jgi:hypothetical protein